MDKTYKTKWNDMSPGVRRLILATGIIDVALRLIAIRDVIRREPIQVNGSRVGWGIALGVVSSGGILPLVYFVVGRRKDSEPGRSRHLELA